MKKLLSLLLIIAGYTASSQNADPYLSIQTIPSSIALNTNAALQIYTGNVGNDTIVANSLQITITVGSNAEILSYNTGASDPRWTQFSLTTGAANTITIRNIGRINSFDLMELNLVVKGIVQAGPVSISGSVVYLPGNNPLLNGAPNNSQGNADTQNDNSNTSLIVTSASCATPVYRTIGSGLFSNPFIWQCSLVPDVNDSAIISTGHSVNLNFSGSVRKLRIETGGTLTVSDPFVNFAIGTTTTKTSPFLIEGTINISNGTLRIYGNLVATNSAIFNQTGGNLVIDGNTGTAATSVPDGTHLYNIGTTVGNFNFTGGKLQFVDPPLGATSQSVNSPHNFGPLSTTAFGDGISTTASNYVNGFGGSLLPATIGKFNLDAVIYGSNRHFTNVNPITIRNEFRVLSGHVIQGGAINVN